ncbi:MAG: hypothetical protein A2288_03375 [Candidatus Moranbacteria bacterium RIFOXYA12_FULL_44_15]|nr:MAG: hypothetical protein A2288_03375 [Candidatus Moranbacteria bacterium RIFOXYA12_FULL_44_15]OGI34937.1 MAG: hypothetical protein A2259_03695 [Candidatus Moranbacteria bacterium RIFOXYA2_FULL_43_15]
MCYYEEALSVEDYGVMSTFYPEDINILNRLYDAVGGSGAYFKQLFPTLPEFVRIWRPISKEDWFWVAEFRVDGKMIEVFFPWCQNWHSEIRLDKSIVFCGEDGQKEHLVIFQKIVDIFWEKYFSQSHHDPRRKLPGGIFSRTLNDGRRVVPVWYVDVRAYLNPVHGGDPVLSHVVARDWFEEQGYEVA